jgi:biotin carboxyl carrier protein
MDLNDKDFEVFSYEGTDYKTLLTGKFLQRRKYEPEDLSKIIAQIPGTIVKIMVKEGQQVNPSKCLFILEAMKMKNRIHPPVTGTIKKIHITEGQIVTKNQLLVELELPDTKSKSKAQDTAVPEEPKKRKKVFGRKRDR